MRRVLLPSIARIPRPPEGPVHVLSGPTMGVTWTVKACLSGGPDPQALQQDLQRLLNGLVMQMSPWEATSDVSRFNLAEGGTWVDAPADLLRVVSVALDWARASDGAFDPTLGRLVDLWGFGTAGPAAAAPSAESVADALAAAGWRKLAVDRANGRLRQPGGVSLDLSGIAKGYAVDAVSADLARRGVANHLVDIGGECRGEGVKPDGQPWWIEIETPPEAASRIAPLAAGLCGLSLATSGDYRRVLLHEGVRYGHTLDARTGHPVRSEVVAATVAHREAMIADVAATVLMALGREAGGAYAEAHGLAARLLLRTPDGVEEWISTTLAAMLE